MNLTEAITTVCIPVAHFWSLDRSTQVDVSFTVYREENQFRAIPSLSAEERSVTGLPGELLFVFTNYCITQANNMEEESLQVIKQIILELQSQDLI